MDRAHRLGQTRTVHVYRLVATGTIEVRAPHRNSQHAILLITRARGAAFQGRVLDAQRFKERIASVVVADVGNVGNASGMVDNDHKTRPFIDVLGALEQGTTSGGRAQPTCPSLAWSEGQYESLDVRAFLASISEG